MEMDGKTFILPDKGIDPNVVAMMNNGCNGNGMWNNPFFYLIFLALFGKNGFGGLNNTGFPLADAQQVNTIQNTLNSQQTNNLVMDAIKGNAGAINSLAAQLGCSTGQLTNAINAVNNNITAQGYQNQLANCQQTNAINSNFAQTNYNMATQCCETKQAIKDNTLAVVDKLNNIESDRKDREITTLTAALASANARAERQAELAPIISQINEIRRNQPSTATVPYPQLSVYPSYLNNLYGTQVACGQVWQ